MSYSYYPMITIVFRNHLWQLQVLWDLLNEVQLCLVSLNFDIDCKVTTFCTITSISLNEVKYFMCGLCTVLYSPEKHWLLRSNSLQTCWKNSSIFIALHFYLYSSNKWRAFYKQLKNEHFTSSNINTHVKGQWVVSLWINTIVQKTQHSRVYILSIS